MNTPHHGELGQAPNEDDEADNEAWIEAVVAEGPPTCDVHEIRDCTICIRA